MLCFIECKCYVSHKREPNQFGVFKTTLKKEPYILKNFWIRSISIGCSILCNNILDNLFLLNFSCNNFGSPPLYSLLPLRAKIYFIKMRLVVAGGGFLFYCTTQHMKLNMESKFVQIKIFSPH